MKDVKVGDRILTAANEFEPVYAFGHFQPYRKTQFLKIETDNQNALEVTADHLLYREGNTNPVRSGSIQVGDRLLSFDSVQTSVQTVKRVSSTVKTGIYAPLTPSGNFLVNRVKVSSYVSIQAPRNENDTSEYAEFDRGVKFMPQHTGIHLLLAPFRTFCHFQTCDTYNEYGMPPHIASGIQMLKWAEEQGQWLQVAMFIPAIVLFSVAFIFERVMFHTNGMELLAFLGFVGMMYVSSRKQRSRKCKAL
jgi:hypothetical protein